MGFSLIPGALLTLLSFASSLNISSVEERSTVFDIYQVDPKLDQTWKDEVKLWYVPMWNKVDLYLLSALLTGEEEAKEMCEVDLNKICAYVTINETDVWHGFGYKMLTVRGYSTPLRPGRYDYTVVKPDGTDIGFVVESRDVLTDNKSYFTEVCLWNDGLLGFVVYSTKPQLDSKDEEDIKNKIKSLGFKDENVVLYSYEENCPDLDIQSAKWRLP